MANLRDYVLLAKHVYDSWTEAVDAPKGWLVAPGMFRDDSPFWKPGADLTSSGLQCRAYRTANKSEAIVAYKGTKPSMASDLRADAGIVLFAEPVQMKEALTLTEGWLEKLKKAGVSRVSLVGHSLGGAIAQYVGARRNVKFVTFNAPGMLANTSGICASPWMEQNIKKGVNFIMYGDPVGNFGRHIGDTVRIKKLSMVKVAIAAGIGAAAASLVGATPLGAAAGSLSQHGIAGFEEYLDAGDSNFKPGDDPLALAS